MVSVVTRGGAKTPSLFNLIDMKRDSLDIYDELPEDMFNYLSHNGRHFNNKLCDFAVSKMKSDTLLRGS